MSFEYIETKDGQLFEKGFYFTESNLKDGERIIFSLEPKDAKKQVLLYVHRSKVLHAKMRFTFDETFSFGFKDKLKIYADGAYIAEFYFNMRGYNADFYLYNDNGIQRHFGEKGKSVVIKEFKQAIKDGFIYINVN